ncbi:MAG: response regulator [Bacteroides fragilis]|nr:response regulator [Bacteroides fragilis]
MSEKKILKKIWFTIIILLVFICVVIYCTNIIHNVLLENTNEMGLSIVKNFTLLEEQSINTYDEVLNICTNYIASRENSGISIEEFRNSFYPFIDGLDQIYGKEYIQIYGKVFNGTESISNNPEIEAIKNYDITNTEWYQGAAAADGKTYISTVYTDSISGLPVITMCKMIPETKSFLAIDINGNYFDIDNRDITLPNDACYYLIDKGGKLIYYLSSYDFNLDEFQKLVDNYKANDICDTPDHIAENIKDSDGIERNVFFHHADNGWIGILTIPRNEILSGSNMIRSISFVLVGFSVILIILQFVQEYRNGKKEEVYLMYQKAMNSTLHAYRAVYYVDAKKETLDTVYPLGKDGKPRHSTYEEERQDRFRYGVIAEESAEQMFQFLDLSYIKKELSEKDYIELQFKRRNFDVNKRVNYGEEYEWCSVAVAIAERKGKEVLTFSMSIRNINDVMKREEEQNQMLALATERAEAASRAKSDFLSRMSHDIRTPMNAILGMTAIAAMHIDEKNRVADALDKITISGKHLLGLINEVLDMSRIESGRVSLTEECFNLSDTIENVLTVFYSQIKAKGLELNASIAELEHENVIGDEQHLQQIFMNIMGNAVKFTPSGGSISIHIEEKPSNIKDNGCYEFIFEDTGIGMEQDYIKTIFEPFSRASNSIGNKIEGTGLGMSIAVNIARMMNGDIKVESTLGKGSKFTVIVHLKLDNIAEEDTAAFVSLAALVIDDEKEACESACEILRSIGMNAEYVLDGGSAVKRLMEAKNEENAFSVVILDWKMPEKDGLETAKEIRKTIGSQIPIIILSAYDWSDVEDDAAEAGINAFISKPMFKSRLIKVLKDVLGQDSKKENAELDTFKQQNFTGKRVLLVEDNEINIEVAREILSVVGIQVETALNGKIAVDRMLETNPNYYDLIFMDIQMPIMNGYDAAKAIRLSEREDLKNIPIVAMTADAFSDDIRKAKEAGMNDHISKPIDVEKLKEALQRWITT